MPPRLKLAPPGVRCPCCQVMRCAAPECLEVLLDQLVPPRIAPGDPAPEQRRPDRPAWRPWRPGGCKPSCVACRARAATLEPEEGTPPSQRELLLYLHVRRRVPKTTLGVLYGVAPETLRRWRVRLVASEFRL